jgi:DNA-binding beta-propeller fold protein YncE
VGGNDGTSDLLTEILITGASAGTIATGVSAPAGIAYDLSTDSFYVADNASGNVTVYDSALAGLVTTIPAPSAFSQPTSLTFIY